jgi:hypothetical protein
MATRYFPQLDDTWRLVQRGVPQGANFGFCEGRDCYVFQRAGGEKPTDKFTTHVIPVEWFWHGPHCNRGCCYLGRGHTGHCIPG